jgi:hypothetical protein
MVFDPIIFVSRCIFVLINSWLSIEAGGDTNEENILLRSADTLEHQKEGMKE